MKLKQCLNRHFYDEDVFETCPFCDSKTPLEIDAQQVVGIVKCVFGNSKGKQYMLHKGVTLLIENSPGVLSISKEAVELEYSKRAFWIFN